MSPTATAAAPDHWRSSLTPRPPLGLQDVGLEQPQLHLLLELAEGRFWVFSIVGRRWIS